jgi:hypothetical protein
MLVKCICTNCAGHLEFEQENAGEEIECPHCGFETKLFLPGTEPEAVERAGSLQKLLRRTPLLVAAAALILAAIGFALHHWVLGPLKDWLPYTESKVLPVLALGVLCLVVLLLTVWIFLPLLFFLQLRKITRVLSQIETNLRPTLPVYPPSEAVLVNEEAEEPASLEELPVRPQKLTSSPAPREQL